MSNFPFNYDNNVSLPPVNDNITEIGGEAINALRDAVYNIEHNLGLNLSGTSGNLSNRINVSLNPDGTINSSALTSAGLVTLPITDSQISLTADIQESKLKLNYKTEFLKNYLDFLVKNVNQALSWINLNGYKLNPHISGTAFNHELNDIFTTNDTALRPLFENKFNQIRNNTTTAYSLLADINSDFVNHQQLDGSGSIGQLISTIGHNVYPSNYSHTASSVYINPSTFNYIPHSIIDLQSLVQYVDSSSTLFYGTRLQNLYSNGISKTSKSSYQLFNNSLEIDGYGQPLVPVTSVFAYLSETQIDNINNGDDIIQFNPVETSDNLFDSQFALVKIGDILRINYGIVETSFLVKEKRYVYSGATKQFIIRINGKNLFNVVDGSATARIDRALYNPNKYGTLSVASANNSFLVKPSLIIANPRGASVTGLGFNSTLFDLAHYLLYLVLYSDGKPSNGIVLQAIDVTGNAGTTPGLYTLDSIVKATNNAFRAPGFNYRFIAFSYQGEFGIALADSYNNASFSILNANVDSTGAYIQNSSTPVNLVNNVVGVDFGNGTQDPLGFTETGANVASPLYQISYSSPEQALKPTKIFVPLKRNNYYVNGIELEALDNYQNSSFNQNQSIDGYGDGYWISSIYSITPNITSGLETVYRVMQDLSNVPIVPGKTIVVQPISSVTDYRNYGRFTIKSINVTQSCLSTSQLPYTDITVFDASHSTLLPSTTAMAAVGTNVGIYFNNDSVSFDGENASDSQIIPNAFKRYFEAYIDQLGKTFTYERARINLTQNANLVKVNIIEISPNLRGYQFGNVVKINLTLSTDSTTGIIYGNLCKRSGLSVTKSGPQIPLKLGQVTRFYDNSTIDYIDVIYDLNSGLSSINNNIDIQLFPSLSFDEEIMMLSFIQYNSSTNIIDFTIDKRSFGNISEEDLSTSALNTISLSDKLLHSNGVINGFDLVSTSQSTSPIINFNGGTVLVDGKIIQISATSINIPLLSETFNGVSYPINWVVCINNKSEYKIIPLTDYDPILNTPGSIYINRIMSVLPVSGSSFLINSIIFSDIAINRKDLVPLYIIGANIVSTVSFSVNDIRKFINDSDNTNLIYSSSGSSFTSSILNYRGNFRNLSSLFNWIKFNSTNLFFDKVIDLSGATGTINNLITFDFSELITFNGSNYKNDSTKLITFNNNVIFGSNVKLSGLNLLFNNISFLNNSSNIFFEDCNIEINGSTNINIQNASNIKFNNCNITIDSTAITTDGYLISLNDVAGFSFNNGNIKTSSTSNLGNVFIFNSSSQLELINTTISGNITQFIELNLSDNINIVKSEFYSTYIPAGLSSSDLVSTGIGYIHSNTSLNYLTIDNSKFYFDGGNLSQTGSVVSRYSFINLELPNTTSLLKDVYITNCKFNAINITALQDDFRPAISIINTNLITSNNTKLPTVSNLVVKNNNCNRSQMILFTSQKDSDGYMRFPGLFANNCIIENNICGTIGYWIGSSNKVNQFDSFHNVLSNPFSSNDSSLIIKENNCNYIGSLDSTGQYFDVTRNSGTYDNLCDYASGNVIIENNKCNWIHANIAYETKGSLIISNNRLSAYDIGYLNVIEPLYVQNTAIIVNSTLTNTINVPYEFTDKGSYENNANCIIKNNITTIGCWITSTYSNVFFGYTTYLNCQASALITGNIFKGIQSNSINSDLIQLGGTINYFINNSIYRSYANASYFVRSYINIINIKNPTLFSTIDFTYGKITDNYFDLSYVSYIGGIYNENNIINVPNWWLINNNKNQIMYMYMPLTDSINGNFNSDISASNYIYNNSSNQILIGQSIGQGNSTFTPPSPIFLIKDITSNKLVKINIQKNISELLPNNARLLNVTLGVRKLYNGTGTLSPSGNTLVSTGSVILAATNTVATSNDITNMDDFTSSTALDAKTSLIDLTSGAVELNLVTSSINTQYLSLDVFPQGITNNNSFICLYVVLSYTRNSAITSPSNWELNILLSPLKIKYTW